MLALFERILNESILRANPEILQIVDQYMFFFSIQRIEYSF